MGVRSAEAVARLSRPASVGPGAWRSLVVFVASVLLLLANGRPIGDADPGGAAGWLWSGARALAGSLLALDATGAAIVGKLLAAAAAATAAAAVFAAVARRHPLAEARWAGLVLVTATTLVAAAQAWSGEAAATAAVAVALWLMVLGEAEDDGRVASRAGLTLALAAFLEPAAAPLALVLAMSVLLRWRRPALLAWAAAGGLPGLAGALAAAGRTGAARASGPDPASAAALLISPAKGLLVFAPVAVVGLVGLAAAWRSAGRPQRWDEPGRSRVLPLACALGVAAQVLTVALLGGWDTGVFWGPRLLAPAWPLLMLFLPEGLAVTGMAGTALVVVSVAVQVLGAFSYDGRWDRLHRDAHGGLGSAAWDAAGSPIAFQWREGVARPSLLGVEGRRLVVREHALVRGSLSGSFVSFADGGLRATGSDATLVALRLEQGARVVGHRLELAAPGDGIAFRVREGARSRRLELRLAGRGQGTVAVGEAGFWTGARWRERTVAGPFRLRLPYAFAETGAADLSVVLRAGGPLALDSVALVPPGDPENVIRLP
ncbi:MAG TPA: hypothetical protein VMX54_19980 [Vicinamibacteria bacterium]|nr:hypothetical protein [Vicinamibacteria bacterium]